MGNNCNIQLENFEGGQQRSHLYRYYLARGFVDPDDVVVDSACGYGYGTELIARKAKKVVGMDRDSAAIKYAMEHYKRDNSYYVVANLDQIENYPICDVVVCVETFEHLRFPESFAVKIMESARRKIFLTCPIVPTKHEDPTHLHDFTESQVMQIFNNNNWGTIDSSKQGIYLMAAFYRK